MEHVTCSASKGKELKHVSNEAYIKLPVLHQLKVCLTVCVILPVFGGTLVFFSIFFDFSTLSFLPQVPFCCHIFIFFLYIIFSFIFVFHIISPSFPPPFYHLSTYETLMGNPSLPPYLLDQILASLNPFCCFWLLFINLDPLPNFHSVSKRLKTHDRGGFRRGCRSCGPLFWWLNHKYLTYFGTSIVANQPPVFTNLDTWAPLLQILGLPLRDVKTLSSSYLPGQWHVAE